jgi:hypothetical protein
VAAAVDPPPATHWHDRAARFDCPRLSCSLTVDRTMTVELLDKHVWGQLLPDPDE